MRGVLGSGGADLDLVCGDENGEVLGFVVVQQGVNWEAQIAKANAVLAVLQWGIELGASKLIVESDCLMVI